MPSPYTLYFLINLVKVFQKHITVHGQIWPGMLLHSCGKLKLRAPRPLSEKILLTFKATSNVIDHVAP